MDTGMSGRSVLVTGGSGDIGAEICRAFAQEGAQVIVGFHRNERKAEELTRELSERWSGQHHSIQVDLTDPSAVEAAMADVHRRVGGPLGALVNNGMTAMDDLTPLGELTEEHIGPALDAVRGTIRCTQLAAKGMAELGFGRIVFVSSALAGVGLPGRGAYVTAKGAMNAFAKNASREFAADGTLVNTVSPAFVLTEGMRRTETGPGTQSGALRDAHRRVGPIGRPAEASDVASLVVYLGSGANTFVNGQVVVVDGGQR